MNSDAVAGGAAAGVAHPHQVKEEIAGQRRHRARDRHRVAPRVARVRTRRRELERVVQGFGGVRARRNADPHGADVTDGKVRGIVADHAVRALISSSGVGIEAAGEIPVERRRDGGHFVDPVAHDDGRDGAECLRLQLVRPREERTAGRAKHRVREREARPVDP